MQDEAPATDPRSARNNTVLLLPTGEVAPQQSQAVSQTLTPKMQERQQSHFKRFKHNASDVDGERGLKKLGTAPGTSFLPAVHGRELLKKKVNKA